MISVIIPTHKRADLLFFELDRIFNQKKVDIEVVVVNDIEEEDETDRIVELYPSVKYIKSAHIQGPSEKHKKGFAITTGDYVYMPDDDDYLIDDLFFYKAVQILEKDSSLSLVSGNVNISYENELHEVVSTVHQELNFSGRVSGLEYLQEFQNKYKKPASTVSTIFRRKSLDGNMIEMSDSSIYMQALFGGDIYFLDDIVAVYRVRKVRGQSLTSSASIPFILNVLKQKETFYFRAINVLPRPKSFWAYHFIATYSLLANKPKCKDDKYKLIKWGFSHSHCSWRLLFFLFMQTIRVGLSNAK